VLPPLHNPEDDITKGSVSFVIERTTETNDDIVYEITAEDKSGNQKVTTLTLKNPDIIIRFRGSLNDKRYTSLCDIIFCFCENRIGTGH